MSFFYQIRESLFARGTRAVLCVLLAHVPDCFVLDVNATAITAGKRATCVSVAPTISPLNIKTTHGIRRHGTPIYRIVVRSV
jgi:hypothetical protein